MRVLIDRKGLQARCHLTDKLRLGVFLTELLSASYLVAFSSDPTFTAHELGEYDVLIITTRPFQGQGYTQEEIRDILDFVRNGGGLLLMSNHAGRSDRHRNDQRKHDAKLASRFGVTLEETFFEHSLQGELTRISGSALSVEHPIVAGASGELPVRSIITNTCCSIVCDEGERLVLLSSEMVDRRGGRSPEGRSFALALDKHSGLNSKDKGRVVVIADSGFVGTDLTTRPGPGLIGHGHNLRFIMNAVRWLGGELG
jgi:hypothetical protein